MCHATNSAAQWQTIAVHVAVIFDDKNKLLVIIRSALTMFAARLVVGFGAR
jgi:hypothetical protein